MSKTDDTALWDGKSCLSCKRSELIIGEGEYVTCGNLECTNPDFGEVLNARFAERERQARIDELQRKMTLNIDLMSSADFKAGFNEALDQIDRTNDNRVVQLNQPEGGSTEL